MSEETSTHSTDVDNGGLSGRSSLCLRRILNDAVVDNEIYLVYDGCANSWHVALSQVSETGIYFDVDTEYTINATEVYELPLSRKEEQKARQERMKNSDGIIVTWGKTDGTQSKE